MRAIAPMALSLGQRFEHGRSAQHGKGSLLAAAAQL